MARGIFLAFIALAVGSPSVLAKSNRLDSDESIYDTREQDWRNGALVYQVLVDRFAQPADLQAKSHLYQAPKIIRTWEEVPQRGVYLEDLGIWSHEIEFWGGDLTSLRGKLGYLDDLGVDVLYLNPINKAFTNHKYDALDFELISPEFGSRKDVIKLADDVHKLGMKLVLDGVFNYMGRNSPLFIEASNSPNSKYRDWFYFGDEYPEGVRYWAQVKNLPELNLENKAVQEYIFAGRDSVVQQYLKDGTDGWRLDVAYDIGYKLLAEITNAAHQARRGSLVVGEIWAYPAAWFPSLDAVMNFTTRSIILKLCEGEIEPGIAAEMIDRIIADAGIEPILKSWLLLDNHDRPRLKNTLPEPWQQKMAQLLQFTLPGSPNLYYGTELGMSGGEDPEMRAPMRWDLVTEDNPTLAWTRRLIEMRKQNRALRVGDFRLVTAGKLFAFERYTDKVADTIIVIVNPSNEPVSETVMIANSSLMNWTLMLDLLATGEQSIMVKSSILEVEIAARSFLVLKPDVAAKGGYTPYKRTP